MHAQSINIDALLSGIMSNLAIWIPILITLISTVITGMTNYPKAAGAVAWLQKAIAVLSWAQHFDSPGSVKLLFFPAKKPAASAPAPTAKAA